MLTSFFGKSRPVNFLILGVFIFFGYVSTLLLKSGLEIDFQTVLYEVLCALLCVLSMMVLDFLVTKNKLTKTNTYTVLFFSCFLVMLPVIFLQNDIIAANFFLLLAFRRIISLRNDTNSGKKILDASLWITVASFFYFWSLLYFIPLWIAIVQKPNTDFKQFLTPFTGFFSAIIIYTAYKLIANDSFLWVVEWKQPIAWEFSIYNDIQILVPATILLGFYIWTGTYKMLTLSSLSLKERPNHLLVLYIGLISLIIALAAPVKTGVELLFAIAPISIIIANYFENNQGNKYGTMDALEFWFKEILLWLVVILAFLFLFL